jgi:hypothetical protein
VGGLAGWTVILCNLGTKHLLDEDHAHGWTRRWGVWRQMALGLLGSKLCMRAVGFLVTANGVWVFAIQTVHGGLGFWLFGVQNMHRGWTQIGRCSGFWRRGFWGSNCAWSRTWMFGLAVWTERRLCGVAGTDWVACSTARVRPTSLLEWVSTGFVTERWLGGVARTDWVACSTARVRTTSLLEWVSTGFVTQRWLGGVARTDWVACSTARVRDAPLFWGSRLRD